jgi:hypothetical protein
MKRDWSVLSLTVGFTPLIWKLYCSTRCPVWANMRGIFINIGPFDFSFSLFCNAPPSIDNSFTDDIIVNDDEWEEYE